MHAMSFLHSFFGFVVLTLISVLDGAEQGITLQGAGSTLPDSLFQDAFFAYRFVKPNVTVLYSGTTTQKGLCRLMSYAQLCDPTDLDEPRALDFVASATPLGASDYLGFPDLQMYPVLASAVAPIYNLGNVTSLMLSPENLALIYSGKITKWDDSRIIKDNPDFNKWGIPPRQSIKVVVRSDVAAVTEVWKKALGSFADGFAAQIGNTSDPTWPKVNVTKKKGLLGMNAYVMATPYSMGYSVLGDATDSGLPVVKLIKGAYVVEASSSSIEHAIMELGVVFGNNGDDPYHLTADLSDAPGSHSWPICNYVYLVIRKDTLRQGATCQSLVEMVAFWRWFLTSDVARALVRKNRHGSLPEVVRETVLARMVADIACDGVPVDQPKHLVQLMGIGPETVQTLFSRLSVMYLLVEPEVKLNYSAATLDVASESDLLNKHAFVVSPKPSTEPGTVSVAFAGVGIAALSTFNLVLDIPTMFGILEGKIVKWLDPQLMALNPNGIADCSGVAINDTAQDIVLLRGPPGPVELLDTIMQAYYPTYTGAAIHSAKACTTEQVLQTAVVGTPYSLAITTLASGFSSMVKVARFKGNNGSTFDPSRTAIAACASSDVYDESTGQFELHKSQATGCYPLSQALYLQVRKSQCNVVTDAARTYTVAFLEWIFSGENLDSAIKQQNLFPLRTNPLVESLTVAALATITCTPKVGGSGNTMLFIIVGVVVGVATLIFVVLLWFYWRSTEQVRAMWRQFSNDNIAQECAAAIACFDLESVAWLNNVVNPNKIQRSFLQIIHLLTEVKPFIPDQLLKSLIGNSGEESSDDDVSEQPLCPPNSHPSQHRGSKYSEAVAQSKINRSLSKCTTVTSCSSRSSDSAVASFRKEGRVRHRSSAHLRSVDLGDTRTKGDPAEAAKSAGVTRQQWTKKRCTFLCAKFGFKGASLEDIGVLAQMGLIASSLVTFCKKHGATIDKVSSDMIAVNWGITSSAADGPFRATLTAMEMIQVCNNISGDIQGQFWLRIAIGYGPCHVATLSAGGHRFFVLCGNEVNVALDAVTLDAFSVCKCMILLSNPVYHEVQYAIKCFPRTWFAGELLWEPVQACNDSATMDEWMYELRKMDEKDHDEFSAQTLLPIFMMVHNEDHPATIGEAVNNVKERFPNELTPQDIASLNHILSTLSSSKYYSTRLADL